MALWRLPRPDFRRLVDIQTFKTHHSRYNLQTRQVALCDLLHRRLRRLCCLHRRSNCYRVERSSSRAGLSLISRRGSAPFHGALLSGC